MAVLTNDYVGGTLIDTRRGPSAAIWGDCPVALLQEQCNEGAGGTYFYDEFISFPGAGAATNGERAIGQWNAFINATAATLGNSADTTNLPLEGGVLGITAGSNNNLSITLAAAPSTFRFVSPATGFPLYPKLWFETSIAVSAVASGNFDLFVGLMDTGDAGTRITSAADLVFSAANTIKTASGMGGCLGFWKRATTNPSDVCIVHNVNNGTAQVLGGSTNIQKLSLNYATNDVGAPGSLHTAAGQAMAALSATNNIAKPIGDSTGGCFIKLGIKYDPNAAAALVATALTGQTAAATVRPLVTFYVNGKPLPIFYDSAIVQASTFPSSFLAPVIGFRTGGTGAGIGYVDFVRAAQLPSI